MPSLTTFRGERAGHDGHGARLLPVFRRAAELQQTKEPGTPSSEYRVPRQSCLGRDGSNRRLAESGCNLRVVGQAEDEIRIDAEDALGAIEGLEVRRMFSGWGFYQYGLLFAAAWDGEFRFRTRQGGHWIYEAADRGLLAQPDEIVSAARAIIARLKAEPAAARAGKRRSGAARRQR